MIDLVDSGYNHISQSIPKVNKVLTDIYHGKSYSFKTSIDVENKAIGGIFPTDQVVLAGRTGTGKSARVIAWIDDFTNLAINGIWKNKVIILWDSFEMSDWRNILRMISREINVPVKDILNDYAVNFNKERQEKLEAIFTKFNNKELYFSQYYSNVQTWEKNKVRIFEKYPNYTFINVVDHTRLLMKHNESNEEQLITGLMNSGMRLKKQYECINIFLSQLNRNIETSVGRNDTGKNLPQSSDIFGSDAVFQTADLVIGLHRPGYYGLKTFQLGNSIFPTGLSDTTKDNLMIECIMKNREGDTPNLVIKHDISVNKFYNYN